MLILLLHTEGYFLGGAKPVELCTLLYHQGAQIPSTDFGPASHLKIERSNSCTDWGCKFEGK